MNACSTRQCSAVLVRRTARTSYMPSLWALPSALPAGQLRSDFVTGCHFSAARPNAVAHVKNEETQAWWRFDDETTSPMERGPVGEAGDHGVQAAPTAPGKVTRPASCP